MSFLELEAEAVDPAWIERRIRWLLKTLPKRDHSYLSRRPSEMLEPDQVYPAVVKGDYGAALRPVCAKYGIDPLRVTWECVDRLTSHDAGAEVCAEKNGPIRVQMLADHRGAFTWLGATLAHELAHAYLTDLDIINGGTWMAEATVDLTTLVCGLGKLTVNEVKTPQWFGDRAGTPSGGYLNREALVFAYALAADEMGVSEDDQIRGLEPQALSYWRAVRG